MSNSVGWSSLAWIVATNKDKKQGQEQQQTASLPNSCNVALTQ